MAPDGNDLTLDLGGSGILTFVDPPAPCREHLAAQYHHLHSTTGAVPGATRIRFGTAPAGRRTLLSGDGADVSVGEDGRFALVDPAGREAQLPSSGEETELLVDPDIDVRTHGTFHQYVNRLVEWRADAAGAVATKGAVVTLPEGTVAVLGFDGSGKTSTLTALLPHATAYLTEERGFLVAPRTLAGLTTVVAYSLGRPWQLPASAAAAMSPSRRLAVRSLPRLVERAPRRLRGRLRAEVADRWVRVDVADAHPGVAFPTSARLDALVFLLPTDGGAVRLEPLEGPAVVAMVQEHARYLHGGVTSPLQAMFRYALPDRPPWPGSAVEPKLARVPDLVDGLPGWALRAPRGADAAAVAAGVREALSGAATG